MTEHEYNWQDENEKWERRQSRLDIKHEAALKVFIGVLVLALIGYGIYLFFPCLYP